MDIFVPNRKLWTPDNVMAELPPPRQDRILSRMRRICNFTPHRVMMGAAGADAGPDTSYSNSGGQGDRTGSITVTSSVAHVDGAIANVVDGSGEGGDPWNSSNMWIWANETVDASEYLRFDFGVAASKIINEVTYKQTATHNRGTWKWQGSDNASSWTDLGGSFTLGTVNTQTQTSLSGNTTGYRYYQIIGVSGTTNSGGGLAEFEFKIVDA